MVVVVAGFCLQDNCKSRRVAGIWEGENASTEEQDGPDPGEDMINRRAVAVTAALALRLLVLIVDDLQVVIVLNIVFVFVFVIEVK